MNEKLWKVRMIRRLTDKVSPDVIVESVIEYELPSDYSDMLESFEYIDEPYKQSVVATIHKHLQKEFGDCHFYPEELICPE